MRQLILFCLLLSTSWQLYTQEIYVSSSINKLYRLDLNTCSSAYVTDIGNFATDISFHPNGILYGISLDGSFYEINIQNGRTKTLHRFVGQSFNALTINASGLVFACGDRGDLWSYNLITDEAILLGRMPYPTSGDLSFFNGVLFAAVSENRIVQVDIDNPRNSRVVIRGNRLAGSIFGIVSYAEDCADIRSFALTGFNSSVYEIDFSTNTLNFICDLDFESYGGASTFEFLASTKINIANISIADSLCIQDSTEIQINAQGGSGRLLYSFDSINFYPDNTFNIEPGDYKIFLKDANDCTASEIFTLPQPNAPRITNIISTKTECNSSNGSITVFAEGGTGILTYAIDGINFQNSNSFENLMLGNYTATVRDSNNCFDTQYITIEGMEAALIESLQFTPTYCGEENGSINIKGISNGLGYSINGTDYQENGLFTALGPGIYNIFVRDDNNCIDTREVQIEESSVPGPPDIQTISTSCGSDNGSIIIDIASGNAFYSLDGSTYQVENVFENLAAGDYTAFARDENNCIGMKSTQINSSLSLSIHSIQSRMASCGVDNGAIEITINGGTGQIQSSLSDRHFQSKILYENLSANEYSVQIVDEANCLLDTTISILRTACPLYVPSGFTPNNDGINDVFQIYSDPNFEGIINTLAIYNRWGVKVFQLQNVKIEDVFWDGTFANKPIETGVYIYIIEYSNNASTVELRKGELTIFR